MNLEASRKYFVCGVAKRLEWNSGSMCGSMNGTVLYIRRSEVNMEQRRNARAGETGDPRGNPSTSDIVRHNSHVRISGSDPAGNRTKFSKRPQWCNGQNTRSPLPLLRLGEPGLIPSRFAHRIFATWEWCRAIPLVGGFSLGSPVPPLGFRCCSILTLFTSPLSALKTSMLRAKGEEVKSHCSRAALAARGRLLVYRPGFHEGWAGTALQEASLGRGNSQHFTSHQYHNRVATESPIGIRSATRTLRAQFTALRLVAMAYLMREAMSPLQLPGFSAS
ncbi:hypothetical protein PR048_024293 [Dryococelus australis]|uniref:Uncharacterized protein n=1 Tax=Dryococelus australis TaxID=614101 RepID=A0ABQ9GN84_9NEOP|nr:hypothetical protein PR048_024293 [Dryococelus australis]